MVSFRTLVAAVAVAVAAAVATVPAASATQAVCVVTTTKCCYTPYICGVVIKTHDLVGYACHHQVVQKVEVPCGHVVHGAPQVHYSYHTYVTHHVAKCYTHKTVTVTKTCFKHGGKKYFAKVCYRKSCSTSVAGKVPVDGVVGTGVVEVGSDPAAYFKKLYGY